jgi:hypothetical protein
MSNIEISGKRGTSGVKKLRELKLQNGLPFMINAKELATNQCYLEYPNGNIKLVAIKHASRAIDIIRELTTAEATDLRRRFHFSYQK